MIFIEQVIIHLPDIIVYIVIGFLFTKTFHFVALKQNTSDVEHLLIESLVFGYIICNVAYLIPFTITYEIDIIGIAVSSIILACILGKIITSNKIIPLLDKLKIRDTFNTYMWDDLMDMEYPMKVRVKYASTEYIGMLHTFESYSNSPHITLASYSIIECFNSAMFSSLSSSPSVRYISSNPVLLKTWSNNSDT